MIWLPSLNVGTCGCTSFWQTPTKYCTPLHRVDFCTMVLQCTTCRLILAGGASSLFSFAPTQTLNMCSWYHEWSPWRSCYIMDTLKGMFTHWPCGLLPFFSKLWLPTKVMYKRYKCFNVQSKYVCVWTFSKEVKLVPYLISRTTIMLIFPFLDLRERLDLFDSTKVLHHLIDPLGDY